MTTETFSVNTETCSGFVAARDLATAQALYETQVRGLYDGRLILSEQMGASETQNQSVPDGPSGPNWNVVQTKFDFHLQVYSPKATGEVGIKYAIKVTRDFLTLEMRTAVSGQCFAADTATANAAVNALLSALNLGASVRSERNVSRQAQPGLGTDTTDVMTALDFDEEYVGRVTGQSGVNEMRVTESIKYSGTRWAVQDIPFAVDGSGGVSIPQPSGIEPGSRTVSGYVTAGTKATAEAWAKHQRAGNIPSRKNGTRSIRSCRELTAW